MRRALVLLLLAASPTLGQSGRFIPIITYDLADLPSASAVPTGACYRILDPTGPVDCSTGAGSAAPIWCCSNGTSWSAKVEGWEVKTTGGQPYLRIDNNSQAWDWRIPTGGSSASLYDVTGATTPFSVEAATPTDTLVVDTSGRVGIGTNAPAQIVEVTGATGGDGVRLTGTGPGLRFQETDGNANENYQISLAGGVLQVGTQNDAFSSFSGVLWLAQSGQVGVGAAPSAKLDVAGTAAADSLLLTPKASLTTCNTGNHGMIESDSTGPALCWCNGSSWVVVAGTGPCA